MIPEDPEARLGWRDLPVRDASSDSFVHLPNQRLRAVVFTNHGEKKILVWQRSNTEKTSRNGSAGPDGRARDGVLGVVALVRVPHDLCAASASQRAPRKPNRLTPGVDALYAPGNATNGEPVFDPEPVTVTWMQDGYT
jgi:hypothetical protein